MSVDPGEALPLREAVRRWCDPKLLAAGEATLHQVTRWCSQLPRGYAPDWVGAENRAYNTQATAYFQQQHESAARALLLDFAQQIERGDINLAGVQVRPVPEHESSIIPGSWAAEFRFDWEVSAIDVLDRRYVSVRARHGECGGAPSATAAGQSGSGPPMRIEDVASFDDDVILVVLEEHARLVVETPDAKLSAAVQYSLMPLIRRKLQHRARNGELLPGLGAEMAWLGAWIAEKAPSFHVPSAASIGNILRSDYRVLAAQTKATD